MHEANAMVNESIKRRFFISSKIDLLRNLRYIVGFHSEKAEKNLYLSMLKFGTRVRFRVRVTKVSLLRSRTLYHSTKNRDILINSEGREISVSGIEKLEEELMVYNLEVEKTHNYFVTKNRVLVHNKKVVRKNRSRR